MHLSTVFNSVIVLDSQEIFGNALASILVGMKIVERARLPRSLDEAVAILESDPQMRLAVVDPVAMGSDGISAVRMLRQRFSNIRIVVASTSSTRDEILNYIGCGAHGYILRTQTGKDIIKAIRVVLSGDIFVPPMVCNIDPVAEAPPAADLATDTKVLVPKAEDDWLKDRIVNPSVGLGVHLSTRQQTVLRLISKGMSNKAIARELGLAESTVKVHVNNVFKALKVNNRIEAVARAGWQN